MTGGDGYRCSLCGAILGDQPGEFCAECFDDLRAELAGEDMDALEDEEAAKLRGYS